MALHNYGPNNIIATAHIQVSDITNAREIHHLTRNIAVDVYTEMGITLTLGIYASNDSGEFKEIYQYINEIAQHYEHIMQIHGFYVDEAMYLISFDVIFSFDEMAPQKIVEEMKEKLKEKFPEYEYHIIIDTDISD